MISSFGVASSPGLFLKKVPEKDFFLEAATDLILYGRTKPDAKLTVNGKEVKLRKDGTFTIRYHLPDGIKYLPIKAVSKEGDMSRSIDIQVKKATK